MCCRLIVKGTELCTLLCGLPKPVRLKEHMTGAWGISGVHDSCLASEPAKETPGNPANLVVTSFTG